MKTRINIVFARAGVDESTNTGLVQLKIYFSRTHRIFRSTGVRIPADAWDEIRGVIKAKTPHLIRMKSTVDDMITRLETREFELMREKRAMTVTEVNRVLKRGDNANLFNTYMSTELAAETTLAASTVASHQNTIRLFNLFNPRVVFADLTHETIRGFDGYLHGLGLATNTIHGHHRRIKRHIHSAIRAGIITGDKNPYLTFRPRKTQNEMVALTTDEIDAVAALDYTDFPQLEWVRDMFLFSCFTGLRFSDVTSLDASHMEPAAGGGHHIVLNRMRKVARPVMIPIGELFAGRGERILTKYIRDAGLVFPYVANPRANELIKQIAYDAGITRRVTFHTARHTFGTQLGARTNDVMLIMALMGISKVETAMIYIKLSKELLTRKVKQITW